MLCLYGQVYRFVVIVWLINASWTSSKILTKTATDFHERETGQRSMDRSCILKRQASCWSFPGKPTFRHRNDVVVRIDPLTGSSLRPRAAVLLLILIESVPLSSRIQSANASKMVSILEITQSLLLSATFHP